MHTHSCKYIHLLKTLIRFIQLIIGRNGRMNSKYHNTTAKIQFRSNHSLKRRYWSAKRISCISVHESSMIPTRIFTRLETFYPLNFLLYFSPLCTRAFRYSRENFDTFLLLSLFFYLYQISANGNKVSTCINETIILIIFLHLFFIRVQLLSRKKLFFERKNTSNVSSNISIVYIYPYFYTDGG